MVINAQPNGSHVFVSSLVMLITIKRVPDNKNKMLAIFFILILD